MVEASMLTQVIISRFLRDLFASSVLLVPKERPIPIIGPIIGDMSIAHLKGHAQSAGKSRKYDIQYRLLIIAFIEERRGDPADPFADIQNIVGIIFLPEHLQFAGGVAFIAGDNG